MTIYICSDTHFDFYVPPMPEERYFNKRFLPADVLVSAGDVANTYDDYAQFLEFISPQYKEIVLCLGNHDITVSFDKKRFKTSEEKIAALKELCAKYPNVHLLDAECVEIGGVKFGGTMGMWDYTFLDSDEMDLLSDRINVDYHWRNSWFDGAHWKYFGNHLERIRVEEMKKIWRVLNQKPDIVLTHFCPIVSKMPVQYMNDYFSTFFYFDRMIMENYTKDGAIWCAGHVHTAYREGNLYVNPAGYPGEHARKFNGLAKEDFLIER